jgi:hypothetical protein
VRLAAACSAVALAIAAGCGGGGDSASTAAVGEPVSTPGAPSLAVKDYQRRVVDAISAMGRFATTLSKVESGNLQTLAPEFARGAQAFADKEAVVEGLTPPARLKDAHQRLVDALQSVSSAMSDLSAAAKDGDRGAFLDADDAFVKASEKVAAAGQALQAASG